MGRSCNRRVLQRSKSFDSYFEGASYFHLSGGGNRVADLTAIYPPLDYDSEGVNSLRKEKKVAEKLKKEVEKCENLRKEKEEEVEKLKEECENLKKEKEEEVEKLKEECENLKREKEEEVEKLKEKCVNLVSELADYKFKVNVREALKNFQCGRYLYINKDLMIEAWNRFPTEFPNESRVLLEHLHELFGAKWRCSKKFWDLLILAYDVFPKEISWEDFGNLMKLGYKFPKKFPKKFSPGDFKKLIETEVLTNSSFHWMVGLLKKESFKENLYNLMKSGRDVFHLEFPHKNFEKLMEKAHDLFPKEFPQECFADTYTGMVAILVNRTATLKDEKLKAITDRRLDCLLVVATEFQWSKQNTGWTDKDFGKQFYFICKFSKESNIDTFHPPLLGERRIQFNQEARKGFFKICGVNVGPVLTALSHIERDREY